MRHPVGFLLPLLLLLPVYAIQAQVLPDSGARVRITNSSFPRVKTVGTLERVTPDTIVVAGQLIIRSTIGRVEVSEGRRSQWRRGLLMGGLVGAGVGALSTAVLFAGIDWSDGNGGVETGVAIMAAVGSGAGLLVGAAIGALIQGDRWRKVPLDRVTLAPMVRRDGVLGLSIGLAF
jgi:hypothetical protein